MLLKKTQACYCLKTDGDILEMLQAMTAERNVESDYVFCTLSGLLGHYSAGFTLDTYGHISTQMQQDAAQKVGGFLRMNM